MNIKGKNIICQEVNIKKFKHRRESKKFTPEQNHIWLAKMEEVFKENKLEDNLGMKKISFTNILSFILLSVLIALIALIFNPFVMICLIGLLAMTCKKLVK